jgi:hypothetical protein
MTGRRVLLILDIETVARSPRGELSAEGQPPRAFSGWLQLGEAIEAALATARGSCQGRRTRTMKERGSATTHEYWPST